jgi:glycosyltransferase involved in cell wall biosynthesis
MAIRLAWVMTHPVQYYSPWFRQIAESCPEIDLRVLYGVSPSAEQQGIGFGVGFTWDQPLLDGYSCKVMRSMRPNESLDRFTGLDVPELAAELRAFAPQVVLIPGWNSRLLVSTLWRCFRAGIPTLYRGESHLLGLRSRLRRVARAAVTPLLLRLYSGYLRIGRRAGEYLRHFGAPAERTWDSPYAVDNQRLSREADAARDQRESERHALGFGPEDFVVVFSAKLLAKKRPADVIRAVARLGDPYRLLVIGSGVEEDACRRLTAELGVRAAWLGFVNQSQIASRYLLGDCLVLPSGNEPWGLVVNEAMAVGLPAVVSDSVGCAADLIVPGRTGEQYRSGDIEDLGRALARVRAAAAHVDFAAACRAHVARYSFATATEGLVAACRATHAA